MVVIAIGRTNRNAVEVIMVAMVLPEDRKNVRETALETMVGTTTMILEKISLNSKIK